MVDLCIHVANVLYLVSFLVWDMLWLRALTCAGLVLGIVFFSCQPMPLYGPTVWHVAFLVINLFQIWRLVLVRRQLRLTKEQETVAQAAFRDLSREELLTLLTHVMCGNVELGRDVRKLCDQQLTEEERVLRAIAFSRLSRKELLNLLTRRLWNSIKRLNPARWRQRRHNPGTTPAGFEGHVSQDPAAG